MVTEPQLPFPKTGSPKWVKMIATMSGYQHNCQNSFKPPSGTYALGHGT